MTNLSFPLNLSVAKSLLEEKMFDVLQILENKTKKPMPIPVIEIKPKMGMKAGFARIESDRLLIVMNSDWFQDEKMWNEALNDTLPHEVCHHIAPIIYNKWKHGFDKNDGWGHGNAWKECMHMVGLSATRCYVADSETYNKLKQRHVPRNFVYKCKCERLIELTSVIHNKIQRGQNRTCNSCKTRIVFYGVKNS